MACITDDIAEASGDRSMNGTTAVLLTIITCDIYGFYWAYKMGELLTKAKSTQVGVTISSDLPVLYLVLQLFKLWIVNLCLMQNELNDMQQ
jgi:acetolactate synthase regulatory subunit